LKTLFLPLKKYAFFLIVFGFCGLALFPAQTAAEIETLLETPAVTYGQAARFVLKASEATDTADPEEAFNFAAERNWLPKDVSPDSEARLDGVSLLFMQSFGLKGGLFYYFFKNPHYAYRELVHLNAFKGKPDPRMAVSGDHLLFITSRVLSIVETE
jgi:hypothetical protein